MAHLLAVRCTDPKEARAFLTDAEFVLDNAVNTYFARGTVGGISHESIMQLTNMMGVDEDTARATLERCGGDLAAAIDECLTTSTPHLSGDEAGDILRKCADCGVTKSVDAYSKTQWDKGEGKSKCTVCTKR